MKLIPFLLALPAFAQSLTLSATSGYAGGSSTLTLTFADSTPSSNAAGFEWALTLPTGITAGAPALGAASTAAAKIATCNGATCIVIGDGSTLNDTVIGSGVLVTVPLSIASTVAHGAVSVSLSSVTGVTATNPSLLTPTVMAGTLTVLDKYDLNGDGIVNSADVAIMIGEVLGTATCSGQSLNVGDGKCDLEDAELEILAALGVIQ